MKTLFKNKKAWLPRDVLISIVMFSVFVVGAFLVVGSMFGSYGIPYTDNSTVYNKVSAITDDVNIMQDSLSSSGASPVGFLEYISTGAWQSLKMLINSGAIIKTIVETIGNEYNIPSIFVMGFLAITTIIILFGIISAVFRKKT